LPETVHQQHRGHGGELVFHRAFSHDGKRHATTGDREFLDEGAKATAVDALLGQGPVEDHRGSAIVFWAKARALV
jgi:hypothetical protein